MRGVQKRIIVVKTDESPYFEEAQFLMKTSVGADTKADIVKEADRILSESVFHGSSPQNSRMRSILCSRVFWFAVGVAVGSGVLLLAQLFFG